MDWKLTTYDVNGIRFKAIEKNKDLICPFGPVPGGCAHFVELEDNENIYCACEGKILNYRDLKCRIK